MRAWLARFRFLLAYAGEYSKSSDHGAAIHAGLVMLSRKPPFDVLSADDIKRVVPVWALMPTPQAVAAMVVNVVRQNDATPLTNKWLLAELAKKWKAISKAEGR